MQKDVAAPPRPTTPGLITRFWTFVGTRRAFLAAFGIAFVFRAWLYLTVGRYSPLTGDESFYWRRTRDFLHILKIETIRPGLSFEDGVSRIVGFGWFLPGMTILMTPARLISDNFAFARFWMAAITFALLVVAARQLRSMFSTQVATLFVLIVGVVPYTAWFSMTLWGGGTGGLIMVLNLLWTVRIAKRVKAGQNPSVRTLALLGMSAGFCVLVRPPTLGQIVAIGALLFFAYAERVGIKNAIPATAWRTGVVLLLMAAVLAPWQIALMEKFGGPFFLVTSSPMNQILRFGDEAELAEFNGTFGGLASYLQDLADERNESFYSATMSERDRILADVTIRQRTSTINRSMRRFFDSENSFLVRGLTQARDNDDNPRDSVWMNRLTDRLTRVNSIAWFGVTLAVLYALFRRWRFWEADGFLGIGMRAMFVLLMFQPLTRAPHGRHISYLVPVFVIFALLAIERRIRGDEIAQPEDSNFPTIERWVGFAFSALVASFVAFYFAG